MRHIRWLAMLTAGLGFLAAAHFAAASPSRYGGIFRVGVSGASAQIDPQVAFTSTAWSLEYATAAKLYNYPDRGTGLLEPEVASGFRVSNRGLTYTFFIRKGFRFSDGSPVTATSFAYAIDRVASPELASPAAGFINEVGQTQIVGVQAVIDGRAKHVSGVVAKGNRLVIRLQEPDAAFLSKITMPFFQATSRSLPLTREVTSPYPSAGPYAFTRNDVNVRTSIRRNRYYRGRRPRNLTGLDVQWNLEEQTAFDEVNAGQLDEVTSLPASEVQGVAAAYGVNRARFWAVPANCVSLLVFDTHRALLANANMRKAVNWALDRTALVQPTGPYSMTPWTHLLPPRFPGSVTKKPLQPFALHPNLAKARQLAGGGIASKKVTIAYRSSSTVSTARASLVRSDLMRLGFAASNITMEGFTGANVYEVLARGTADLGVSPGECITADFPDPQGLLSVFLAPHNLFGVDSLRYRSRFDKAAGLPLKAKVRALGKLDVDLMRSLAPAAVIGAPNSRYFFSSRVVPRSLAWSSIYQDWSIPALALK